MNAPNVETGYCALHNRRRTRIDLMEWTERPGQLRCLPRKECHARVEAEAVMCQVHNRRRNVHQMVQVSPGVYECKPEHMCRGFFSGGGEGGSRPFGGVTGAPGFISSSMGPAALPSSFAPSAFSSAIPSIFPGVTLPQPTMHPVTESLPHEVWCAKHGKKILRGLCDFVDDVCYVCRNSAACRSTPLEKPEHLRSRRSTELLCSKHHSLRLPTFLCLKDDGYECLPSHQCRGVSAPSIGNGAVMQQEAQGLVELPAGGPLSDGGILGDGRQAVAPSSFFS
jgi:hypothetical protein